MLDFVRWLAKEVCEGSIDHIFTHLACVYSCVNSCADEIPIGFTGLLDIGANGVGQCTIVFSDVEIEVKENVLNMARRTV